MAREVVFFTAREAQAYTGLSKMSLYRKMSAGIIPAIQHPLDRRFKIIRKSDLDAYLAKVEHVRGKAGNKAS